jgi:hypothetical protein
MARLKVKRNVAASANHTKQRRRSGGYIEQIVTKNRRFASVFLRDDYKLVIPILDAKALASRRAVPISRRCGAANLLKFNFDRKAPSLRTICLQHHLLNQK